MLITVAALKMGSFPETLLKPKIFRIDPPFPLIYPNLSDMNLLSVYVFKRSHTMSRIIDALR